MSELEFYQMTTAFLAPGVIFFASLWYLNPYRKAWIKNGTIVSDDCDCGDEHCPICKLL